MKDLISIILNLDKRKLKHIKVLINTKSCSDCARAYNEILKGKIKDDGDLAFFLYKSREAKSTSKYEKLKKELVERFHNSLLFINTENNNWDDILKFKYEANRNWLIIKNISFNQLNDYATKLAENLLPKAIYNEYTEIALELLGLIKSHYSINGSIKIYEQKQTEYDVCEKLLYAERKARSYKEGLRVYYAKSAALQPDNALRAKKYHDELKPYLEKYNSYTLHLNAYLLEVYIYSSVNDYAGWHDVAQRGINYIKSKPFNLDSMLSTFLAHKGTTAMYLKNYTVAEQTLDEAITLADKNTYNWFKYLESKMFLLFRMHRYKEALKIFNETIVLPEFKIFLHDFNSEMWNLMAAYLYFFKKLGKIHENVFDIYFHVFSLTRFLNEIPAFDTDKNGMHFVSIILELSLYVTEKNFEKIKNKEESLKRHLYRRTEKTELTDRFEIFIKMLLEFPRVEYDRFSFSKNTNILLNELKTYDNRLSENMYRLELIELEDLWEILINQST